MLITVNEASLNIGEKLQNNSIAKEKLIELKSAKTNKIIWTLENAEQRCNANCSK